MTKKLIAGGVILVALGAGLLWWQESSINSSRARMATEAPSSGPSVPRPASTPRVPAHFVVAPAAKSLAPTLPPEQFFGSARDGYVKAKEIAPTLAQLPCYCDCDLHMGHKSLHTC